jgi:hypothetical protein
MSIFNKRMNGQTTDTKKHVICGAGVIAINYDLKTDTYESAKKAGKLIATKGGCTFDATVTGHYMTVDGVPENTKGNYIIDRREAKLTVPMEEITARNLEMLMAAADTKTLDGGGTEISPRDQLEDDDYLDNVVFINPLAGAKEPMIIELTNVVNMGGISIAPKDGDEATVNVEFNAHYDLDDLTAPIWKIRYPDMSTEEG